MLTFRWVIDSIIHALPPSAIVSLAPSAYPYSYLSSAFIAVVHICCVVEVLELLVGPSEFRYFLWVSWVAIVVDMSSDCVRKQILSLLKWIFLCYRVCNVFSEFVTNFSSTYSIIVAVLKITNVRNANIGFAIDKYVFYDTCFWLVRVIIGFVDFATFVDTLAKLKFCLLKIVVIFLAIFTFSSFIHCVIQETVACILLCIIMDPFVNRLSSMLRSFPSEIDKCFWKVIECVFNYYTPNRACIEIDQYFVSSPRTVLGQFLNTQYCARWFALASFIWDNMICLWDFRLGAITCSTISGSIILAGKLRGSRTFSWNKCFPLCWTPAIYSNSLTSKRRVLRVSRNSTTVPAD